MSTQLTSDPRYEAYVVDAAEIRSCLLVAKFSTALISNPNLPV